MVTFFLSFSFGFTVIEALDIFFALNSDSESNSDHERKKCNKVFIQPPVDSAVAETHKYSDKSDHEVQGIFDHLAKRIAREFSLLVKLTTRLIVILVTATTMFYKAVLLHERKSNE